MAELLTIPPEERAAIDAKRKARGWSWRRFSIEAGVGFGTLYDAVHRGYRTSPRMVEAIALAFSGEGLGAYALPSEPDPDSIEWRAQIEDSDRRFSQAMALMPTDFAA